MGRCVFLFSLLLFSFAISSKVAARQAPPTATSDTKEVGGAAILYGEGGAFMATGPKEWTADYEVGKQIGTCCVFYPKGSTWDDAVAVMYPSLVVKKSDTTLEKFMTSDLEDFKANNPGMTFEDALDVPIKLDKKALLRYFHGVNKGSSEAVAYIDEQKIIAVFVLSAKSGKALNDNLPVFKEFLTSYIYMDAKIVDSLKSGHQKQ